MLDTEKWQFVEIHFAQLIHWWFIEVIHEWIS